MQKTKMAASVNGPLTKIKVLEFAGLAPVPLAGMILSDFGASVTRVDRFGDHFAQDVLARGKKSIVVNLKKQKGIEIIKKLSRNVDVVIEPFRPTVMEKLGLGPKELIKENEKLIYARLTGRSTKMRKLELRHIIKALPSTTTRLPSFKHFRASEAPAWGKEAVLPPPFRIKIRNGRTFKFLCES